MDNDKLVIGGHEFRSRFILGSGKYSLNLIEAGRKAYLAGLGRVLTRGAAASDPLTGFLRD